MKDQTIKSWLERPIELGDTVDVKIDYQISTVKGKKIIIEDKVFTMTGTVDSIHDTVEHGKVYVIYAFGSRSVPSQIRDYNLKIAGCEPRHGSQIVKAEYVTPNTEKCGIDPFKSEPPRVNFYNKNIDSILSDCGYGRRSDNFKTMEVKVINTANSKEEESMIGMSYGGCNFDPYVTDKDGKRQYFQRGLVWTLQQKQDLIESIYNWIEIGKFVFRYKSWNQLAKEMKADGHGYNWECVDGKQRLNAILEFVQNKYPDNSGNYWEDLSKEAQRRILSYDRLAFGKLEENTSDSDVIRVFLTLNFTGVPMSRDHIAFVQSINL